MSYRMIIRSNLNAQDLVINASDPLETSLNYILTLNTNPSSLYFIESEYLLFRLYDCVKRVVQTSFNPGNCPIMFDSWSCWNSTPLARSCMKVVLTLSTLDLELTGLLKNIAEKTVLGGSILILTGGLCDGRYE